jgi:hypothetical protein
LLSSTALPPTVVVVVAETSDKEEASPSRAWVATPVLRGPAS